MYHIVKDSFMGARLKASSIIVWSEHFHCNYNSVTSKQLTAYQYSIMTRPFIMRHNVWPKL